MTGPATGPLSHHAVGAAPSSGLPPICLDLSRIARRASQEPATGIDRVDRAYLAHVLDAEGQVFGLVRTRLGYLLLDRAGLIAARQRLLGAEPWAESGGSKTKSALRRAALSALRRLAVRRASRWGLRRLMTRGLPMGCCYLNTSHTNLSAQMIAAAQAVPGGRAVAMIHDTIPLDLPETADQRTADRFRRTLDAALGCDLLLANSALTHDDILRFAKDRETPRIEVLLLGLTLRGGAPDARPHSATDGPAEFIMLGTIEPRKNHALILDVWQHFHDTRPPAEIPHLVIVGGRGWLSEDLFQRLDHLPYRNQTVHEVGRLSDDALSQRLGQATALLFPSRAEGFGLPPMEAAAIGLPVISTDLPSVRAVLGEYPVYANPDDMYQWITAIDNMAAAGRSNTWKQPPPLPTWQSHFRQLHALL